MSHVECTQELLAQHSSANSSHLLSSVLRVYEHGCRSTKMKHTHLALLLIFSSVLRALPFRRAPSNLTQWPAAAAIALDDMIARNAHQGNFACFDMDQTSYQWDLTESLLPWLEQKDILNRDNLDPSLKIIPFKDTENFTESLYSYYWRLCEIDNKDKFSVVTRRLHTDSIYSVIPG